MLIDKSVFSNMLLKISELWKLNSPKLSEIDSKFGDGDHGVTIQKIALLLEKSVEEWTDKSICDYLDKLGCDIMAVSGGSAGPLYGTMIGGLSEPLIDHTDIDGFLLKNMMKGSLDAMRDITSAKVGDKTMMDSLIPAVEAACNSSDNILDILEAASKAAEMGAIESKQYIAKYGRAKSYKEQTIGTSDVGAISTAIFFKGLAEGYKSLI